MTLDAGVHPGQAVTSTNRLGMGETPEDRGRGDFTVRGSFLEASYRRTSPVLVSRCRRAIHRFDRANSRSSTGSRLALVHFRIVLAGVVLGRTGRVDQRRIDDRALAQRQTPVAP